MLGSKKTLIFALSLVCTGVGYNVWHFASKKRRPSARPTPVAAASLAPKSSKANGRGTTIAPLRDPDLVATLEELLADFEHDPLSISGESLGERDPFRLLQEQREGLSWAQLVERELERRRALAEEEARLRAEAEEETPEVEPTFDLGGLRLTAIIKGPDGSLALIDGHILSVGDLVPGTEIQVASIEDREVQVSQGEQTRRLVLDP